MRIQAIVFLPLCEWLGIETCVETFVISPKIQILDTWMLATIPFRKPGWNIMTSHLSTWRDFTA